MGELVPSYPQPYRLFNPPSGHPLYSGPNGEPGYGGLVLNSVSWVQPDGVIVWYHPGDVLDQGNRVALGLDSEWNGDGGIGYSSAYAAAQREGANADQADIAAAISLAESGGHWSAHNSNRGTGDDSIGLWQINLLAHPQYRDENLYNIDANAAAMADVSSRFTDWNPWSTYKSGAFRQYLRGAGQPITSGPAPSPVPPPSAQGPVERLIDGLVGDIPNIPLVGGAIRDGVRSVLHPLAAAIDAGIAFVAGAVSKVASDLAGAITSILSQAARWVQDAEQYTRDRFTEAFTYIAGLITDAIHAAEAFASFVVGGVETVARDLVNAASAALTAALDFGINALRTVIDGVQAALTAAFDFGVNALRTVIGDVQAALTAALNFAVTALRDALGVVDSAWREALGALETELKDLIAAAGFGLQAFVRDVFAPLEAEVRHWIDDVLSPIAPLLDALGSLVDWIVAAAKVITESPADVAAEAETWLADNVNSHVVAGAESFAELGASVLDGFRP